MLVLIQSAGCIYSNKDKNFKANHNINFKSKDSVTVVSIVTKIRILKQITTIFKPVISFAPLYL